MIGIRIYILEWRLVMQFNSTSFLFLFLPIFLIVYYVLPRKARSWALLGGSLVFYWFAGSDPWLILGLLVGNLLFSRFVAREIQASQHTWLLVAGLLVLAGELVFFKLYNGGKLLPVGMSFYLFQMAAYVIDAYRGHYRAEYKLSEFGAQMVMFPKLLMGPLMDPADLQRQIKKPHNTFASFHKGMQLFILGLALKVLLANRIGGLWAQAATIGHESISTIFAWMALTAYAMQLYFDFWGYSLMAMGLGYMLGFQLPENFIDPYASRSVSEFWRRWHVTLGAWFRNYVYIPLGGNRGGTLRTLVNLLAVWAFTGFWHGVGGNYLLWAAILFFFIANERLWLRKYLDRSKALSHVYTVVVILVSWVPFAIGDWDKMVIFLVKLFGLGGPALNPTDYIVWGKEYLWLLIGGLICATPLPRWLCSKLKRFAFTDFLLFILFWVAVFYIATSAQDPFLYFQF